MSNGLNAAYIFSMVWMSYEDWDNMQMEHCLLKVPQLYASVDYVIMNTSDRWAYLSVTWG